VLARRAQALLRELQLREIALRAALHHRSREVEAQLVGVTGQIVRKV
jgi:hypothetical protein